MFNRNKRKVKDMYSKNNIIGNNSSFAVAEAYKSLRTNLLFTKVGTGCQKIVITSAMENEGKTVNCINLAITLAQNGLKVLIIDADMRKPMVANDLELERFEGLSNVVAGLTKKKVLDYVIKTKYENLSVLGAGDIPPNPAELLASKQMEPLLNSLESSFDYILIDTPPVTLLTDAVVLASLVQGYLFVVRSKQVPIEQVKKAVTRLKQVDANIIGFILNDVDANSGYYRKYYYRKYYQQGEDSNFIARLKEGSQRLFKKVSKKDTSE